MSPDRPNQDDSDATSDATGTEETADNGDTDNGDTDNVDAAVAAIAADMGFSIEGSGDVVPDDLRDLRHRLNYLKNLYDIKEQVGMLVYLHHCCPKGLTAIWILITRSIHTWSVRGLESL